MTTMKSVRSGFNALPFGTLDDIVGAGSPLILAPHPDDESLGCGGLIAACCARGTPPYLVMVTDGSASHPRSRIYPPERLRCVREAEAHAAIRLLGMPDDAIAFLGLRDAAAPSAGPVFEAVTDAVAGMLRVRQCSAILAPWRHDPHCDHVAADAMARRIAALTGVPHRSYPVWGWALPDEHDTGDAMTAGWRLDITTHLGVKHAAIAAHRSQHSDLIYDDPTGFRLPPDLLAVFARSYEVFVAA